MRAAKIRSGAGRELLGVAVLGVLACSLALAGAPVRRTASSATKGGDRQTAPTVEETQGIAPQLVVPAKKSISAKPLAATGATEANSSGGLTEADSGEILRPRAANETTKQRVIAGQMPQGELPLIAKMVVDYRADEMTKARREGRLVGALPQRSQLGGVAAGGCSFAVDCDDANKCTIDTCDIMPGTLVDTGKCVHTPVADGLSLAVGGCDDGEFCNGEETCTNAATSVNGVCNGTICVDGARDGQSCSAAGLGTSFCQGCTPGQAPTCCADRDICMPEFATCSPDSVNAGEACLEDEQCRQGTCQRCQKKCETNNDCRDLLVCNGAETCDTGTGNCVTGVNPCGADAFCNEGRCYVPPPVPPSLLNVVNKPCTTAASCPNAECVTSVCSIIFQQVEKACKSNADCGADFGVCVPSAGVCHLGRCCDFDVGELQGGETGHLCGKRNLAQCATFAGGGNWYAGDGGREIANTTSITSIGCGNGPDDRSESWGCPRYASGMTQTDAANPPVHPITVGPVSDAPVDIPLPGGPDGPLNQLGDDYTISTGGFTDLDVVRWIGGMVVPNRIIMEFWDDASPPNIVEDIVLEPITSTTVGVVIVEFRPPLTIPAAGYMVMRPASNFAPNSRFVWLSADSAAEGASPIANNPNVLWLNGGPSSNFLSPHPGILTFELAGDTPTAAPAGGCCEADGDCTDNVLPWVCTGGGNSFLGAGVQCATCNGGNQVGNSCRTCVDGGRDGLACTGDAGPTGCPDGSCETNNDSCPGAAFCSNDVNTPCPNGVSDCAPGPGVTCGTPQCLLNDTCGSGACCDPVNADCTIAASDEACTGTWKGFGSTCDPNCCRVADLVGQRCMGGPVVEGTCDAQTLLCSTGDVGATCTVATQDADCDLTGNNLQTCTSDANCRECSGGPNNGDACTVHADCARCRGGTNSNEVCSVDADCPDDFAGSCVGHCLGHCVTRGTGADNCADAVVHVISIPTDGEPKTITISGNNDDATSTIEDPDSCFGVNEDVLIDDPAWWEAFKLTGQCSANSTNPGAACVTNADCPTVGVCENTCAWIRLDFCCSEPIHEPAYSFMTRDCACDDTFSSNPNPHHFGERPFFRGPPFCNEDNLWVSFGPLFAGNFYYPILSDLAGSHGDYQLHITVEACPSAACCHEAMCAGGPNDGQACANNNACRECSNSATFCNADIDCPGGTCLKGRCSVATGTACDVDGDCPGGEVCNFWTCRSCDVTNQTGCDAIGGYWLAEPQLAQPIPICTTSEPGQAGNPCNSGSCCKGPGECEDNRLLVPMTAAICNTAEFNFGDFVGGVLCGGGTCEGGSNAGFGCRDPEDFPGDCPGAGTCEAGELGAQAFAQPIPCPICEHNSAAECNPGGGRYVWLSDESTLDNPTRQCNDIMPTETGVLSEICVLGTYITSSGDRIDECEDTLGGPPPQTRVSDSFTVRLYAPDPDRYFPGELLGEWDTTHVPAIREATQAHSVPLWGDQKFYDFQIQLTPTAQNPLVTLEEGLIYFLEISNNTTGGMPECDFWMSDGALGAGNSYAFLDGCSTTYTEDSVKLFTDTEAMSDPTWCMNVPFESPPSPISACYTGNPLDPCFDSTIAECAEVAGNWQFNPSILCTPEVPVEPNDLCADAPFVKEGSFGFNMFGALRDGSPSEQCEFAEATNMDGDIWFKYRPTQGGLAYFGTCDCEQGDDVVVSIYTTDPPSASCPCPGETGFKLLGCYDEAFVGELNFTDPGGCPFIGQAEFITNVTAGICYTVRVAMFENAFPERNRLRIALSPAKCGNGVLEPLGGEQCDGPNADSACDGQCSYACVCPEPVCGDGDLDTPLGEECDDSAMNGSVPCTDFNTTCRGPGDPAGECTCIPVCGNGRREGGELCDGADASFCSGAGCNAQCLCNADCGNNNAELGEECDGTDATPPLCTGRCGVPDNGFCDNGTCVAGTVGSSCTIDANCDGTTGTCAGGQCTTGQVGLACTANADCNVRACTCPVAFCGNNAVEDLLNHEECDGTATEAEGSQCPPEECRPPGDPALECTCACVEAFTPPGVIVWGPATVPIPWPNTNSEATTRTLRFTVDPPATATGTPTESAIKVTMVDLQNPVPANVPQFPPKNFACWEAGASCGTDIPAAPPVGACSATTEANGCARWIGKPGTFMEAQGPPATGPFRAARLQCTPFYFDWVTETSGGPIAVAGAEIVPSSQYSVQAYGSSCKGVENGCPNVSAPVTMYTRRSGDVASPFVPPDAAGQPNSLDVVALVNKFKGSTIASHVKAITQLQPNLPELNADVGALDIVAGVDAVKELAYAFSGPCPCPSLATCNALACSSPGTCTGSMLPGLGTGAMCVKTCSGGGRPGDPCINDTHCDGGTCGNGACRDRCGRCN